MSRIRRFLWQACRVSYALPVSLVIATLAAFCHFVDSQVRECVGVFCFAWHKWFAQMFWGHLIPGCGYYAYVKTTGRQQSYRWLWFKPRSRRWNGAAHWWVFSGFIR